MNLTTALSLWKKLNKNTYGKKLFSLLVGKFIPYTGTVKAVVNKLDRGDIEVLLPDRKKNRNHLNCIHALALANAGELSTGLALLTVLENNYRFILTELKAQYHSKARGNISCQCKIDPKKIETGLNTITAKLFDKKNTHVATITADWKIDERK